MWVKNFIKSDTNVTYFLFYFHKKNDSDDEISHLEWETVRVRFVKAATLDRLIDALVTDDGELESTFVNVFLGKKKLQISFKNFNIKFFSYISNVYKDRKGFRTSA